MQLSVAKEDLVDTMQEQAEIGATADGGLHRRALSDEDKRVRDWLVEQMDVLGLDVRVDEFGNMFGRREGTDPDRGPFSSAHISTRSRTAVSMMVLSASSPRSCSFTHSKRTTSRPHTLSRSSTGLMRRGHGFSPPCKEAASGLASTTSTRSTTRPTPMAFASKTNWSASGTRVTPRPNRPRSTRRTSNSTSSRARISKRESTTSGWSRVSLASRGAASPSTARPTTLDQHPCSIETTRSSRRRTSSPRYGASPERSATGRSARRVTSTRSRTRSTRFPAR